MAKKEYIKLTHEGLNLLTIMNFSGIGDTGGFYNKEVYFTDGFAGNVLLLSQCLGNLGAYPQTNDLDSDIHCIIISNNIMDNPDSQLYRDFVSDMEARLNQNNSPYRRIRFITENHLIWYLENRIKLKNDDQLDDLLKKYRQSRKENTQQELF
jgi:hypothetical protein